MAYENIKLPVSSFTIADGYFYFFSASNDLLYQKNTKGDVTFTYPLEDSLGGKGAHTVHFDGTNFWTLQDGVGSMDRIIRKWRIEKFFCKLIDTIELKSSESSYNYVSSSMAVESFSTTLSGALTRGSSSLSLISHNDQVMPGTLITLGPNNEGLYEEVTVTGTLNTNTHGLDFYTMLEHEEGEKVAFSNSIWLFNNYTNKVNTPSLNEYSLIDNSIIRTYQDSDLINMSASTFYYDNKNKYVLFVYRDTLRFFNTDSFEVSKTMVMDNIRADGVVITPISEIELVDDTLYRLQNYMTYYGTNYSQSTRNYQCSTIRPFIDSISTSVYPKILSSDGMSIAETKASVQTQYGEPAIHKKVYFTDDDEEYGHMTIHEPLTDTSGEAVSYYRAGVSPKEVTITAYVTQYD